MANVNLLLDSLDSYKNILSKETYEYLFSLLSLECSALDDEFLSNETRESLSNIKIYKDLLAFNITNLIKEFLIGEGISFNESKNSLSVKNKENEILSVIVGQGINIYLNTYIHSFEKRKSIISELQDNIKSISSAENPYDKDSSYYLYYQNKLRENLTYYQNMLKEVKERKNSILTEKLEIENVALIDKLLDELKVSYFKEKQKGVSLNKFVKRLTREYPLVKIEKNINYL